MKTVRIMLALAIGLLIAFPAAAQEKPKKRGKQWKLTPTSQIMLRMGKLREVIEELDLTAEQEGQLEKIREELGPKMREVFGKMRELLTKDQRSAAETAMKEAQESGKEGRQFFVAIESAIKLTDEQKEQMAKIHEELVPIHRQMMRKVRGILTPEQQEKVKAKMRPNVKKEKPEKTAPAKEASE
jgi:Spy/CpxP family protein refolding chaperone